jgi:hypothetical protein
LFCVLEREVIAAILARPLYRHYLILHVRQGERRPVSTDLQPRADIEIERPIAIAKGDINPGM